jgi:hypothetical protein
MIFFYLLIPLLCAPLYASLEESCEFYILENREGAGMFSMFADVLSLICSYELGLLQGFEVDFGEEGLYWEKTYGLNWWSYYCEPISLGEKKNVCRGEYSKNPRRVARYDFKNREEAHALIQKYIRFRSPITHDVEAFENENFKDCFVIGIHYRGTDAPESSPSYEVYPAEVQKIIHSLKLDKYKIFISTDEQPFIDYMENQFPSRVCSQSGILRSVKGGEPLHFNSTYSRYAQGKETLADCLLLSKSSFLLLSYSNLSLWASFFNPYVPLIDLSQKLPVVNPPKEAL